MQQILSLILKNNGITIIYCRTIRLVCRISQYLRNMVEEDQRGSIRSFHSDFSDNYKREILQMFKAGDLIKAVVATDALGMVS